MSSPSLPVSCLPPSALVMPVHSAFFCALLNRPVPPILTGAGPCIHLLLPILHILCISLQIYSKSSYGGSAEIILKKFGNPKIISTFAIPIAEIAQLVEHDLAKVGVASSSLVFRSSLKVSFPLTFFHALTFRTALYMMRHRVCGK